MQVWLENRTSITTKVLSQFDQYTTHSPSDKAYVVEKNGWRISIMRVIPLCNSYSKGQQIGFALLLLQSLSDFNHIYVKPQPSNNACHTCEVGKKGPKGHITRVIPLCNSYSKMVVEDVQ